MSGICSSHQGECPIDCRINGRAARLARHIADAAWVEESKRHGQSQIGNLVYERALEVLKEVLEEEK